MNILEAFNSGKQVRRKGRSFFHPSDRTLINAESVVADDWEIEEQKIELTKAKVFDAIIKAVDAADNSHQEFSTTIADILTKELGFKDSL